MILVFLLLLSACAACHTCEDPAFERITSTTIIEKKEVGFSGLLVILENSVRNLAEKQANMTSGMNHSYFNLADSAVGNDAYNHDEEIFLADSRNASNLRMNFDFTELQNVFFRRSRLGYPVSDSGRFQYAVRNDPFVVELKDTGVHGVEHTLSHLV